MCGVVCEGGIDGYVSEKACDECACYCSGGQALGEPICCQDGLVWDPSLDTCNWPDQVPSCH